MVLKASLDDTKYKIGDVPINKGDKILYTYDLGDQYWFMITLESIDPSNVCS